VPGRHPSAPPVDDRPPQPAVVPFLESMTDGPTVRLAGPEEPGRTRRGRWSVLACLVALLAMAGAAFAALLGWRALDQSQVARDMAARGGLPTPVATTFADTPQAVPPDATVLIEPSAAASPPVAPSVSPTGPPGWVVRYADRTLTVPVGCGATVFLDLDEPRAEAAGGGADVQTGGRCSTAGSTLRLGPGAGAGAEVTGGPAPDAAGCDQRLRTAALAADAGVPVRSGSTLCVRTRGAGKQGPALVRLEITAVDGGRVTMRATSWFPGG
jgi:hypothetical protein